MQTMKGNTNNQTIYKRPTPPRLNKALSPMETIERGRGPPRMGVKEEEKKVGEVERDANPAKCEDTH